MHSIYKTKNNGGEGAFKNDIVAVYDVPGEVKNILKISCYDCHSNHTNYPWYAEIQPVGWWLQQHVDDGKKSLNFSKFASYSKEDQVHVLKETVGEIKSGKMPLKSYVSIHKNATFTSLQKKIIVEWAASLSERIAAE